MKANKLIFFLLIISCGKSELEFQGSTIVENNTLYVERYYSHKGGIGGYLLVYFITDSASFKKRIGECDEKERIGVKLLADTILITKYTSRNLKENKVVKSHIFSLSKLIEAGEKDK